MGKRRRKQGKIKERRAKEGKTKNKE